MRRKLIWIAAALVLVALPAVIGLVALRGDDSSSRRAAALVQVGGGAGGYQLVVSGLTPSGQAADVLSYSWGVTNNASVALGGLSAGKAQFSDLQITKKVDTTSPLFVKGAAQGAHYPTATLTIYKGGEKPNAYLIYQMTDVMVTAVQHGGSADDVPTEQVSLAYAKLQLTSKELDETGAAKAQTTMVWDLASAKAG